MGFLFVCFQTTQKADLTFMFKGKLLDNFCLITLLPHQLVKIHVGSRTL